MAPRLVRTRRPFSEIETAALDDLMGVDVADLGAGLFFDRKGQPMTMLAAGLIKWERPGYERVGLTFLDGRLGPAEISTVWLGMDHGWGRGKPVIFETMIFCEGELDLSCWRWTSLRQAQIGHRRIVKLVKLMQRQPKVLAKPHKTRNRR